MELMVIILDSTAHAFLCLFYLNFEDCHEMTSHSDSIALNSTTHAVPRRGFEESKSSNEGSGFVSTIMPSCTFGGPSGYEVRPKGL